MKHKFTFFTYSPVDIASGSGTHTRNNPEGFYSLEDFITVPKIDAHLHIHTTAPGFGEILKDNNFKCISINTEVPDYAAIEEQQNIIAEQRVSFPDNIFYLTTFETQTIFEEGWVGRQVEYLKESFRKGAVGVKVWKNIGMDIKDQNGKFIMIDDPVFDPIFDYLEENKIPVCGHIAEPKSCWLPLDQMTTNNDRDYFRNHPQYHMYLHPEFPSYYEIIEHRDNLLEKRPGLLFVGAHLGSLEWSLDEMTKRLDRFSLLMFDVAERMSHIQYLCIDDWKNVRDFFINYQDRIIYGTDLVISTQDDNNELRKRSEELWLRDWKFFTSNDEMLSPLVNGAFRCLHLPKVVINKIYYENALKRYFSRQ